MLGFLMAIQPSKAIQFIGFMRLACASISVVFFHSVAAQVVFNEPFDEANTSIIGTDNVGGVTWTSSCPSCLPGDYWHVLGGVLEGNDTNGDAVFETGIIDITSACGEQVNISLTVSEVGELEACGTGCNSVDWVRLEYNINGTGWVTPGNSFACAGACAGLNVILADDILPAGTTSYSTGCIGPGNTLQMRIGVQCWAASEFWRIDNVNVSFCPVASNLIITNPAAVCAPSLVDLTVPAITAGSSAGTLSYWMDAAATIPLANPNAVSSSGTYYIQLGTGGCPIIMPVIVVVNPSIIPSFTPISALCQGTNAPILPTTSTNGISGSWSPSVSTVAAGTTLYTFTPTSGQCASAASLSITVSAAILPTFSAIPTLCIGDMAPVLPTISLNGISGSWSPAISTSNAGTTLHTFTPNFGQCASITSLTVTVSGLILPTFTAIGTVCQGAPPPVLPTTSLNGIAGSWSPLVSTAVVGTLVYTFTPNPGQCAIANSLSITVSAVIVPTFSPIANLCQGAAVPILPTTSTNGITGSWSPTISTSTVGTSTYSFTSAAGQCASTTLDLTIDPLPIVNAGIDQTVCEGTSISLIGSGADTYMWDNGALDGISFVPSIGMTTYTVLGTDANGCSNADQVIVIVSPMPVVNAGIDQSVCLGDMITLNGTGAAGYSWDNGVTNGVPFTPALGTLTYTVVGSNASGCSNADQVIVTVEIAPVVSFTVNNTNGCAPLVVTFTNTTPGILTECQWDFGNGASAIGCGSVSTDYPTSGFYDVTLTTTSDNGCTSSITFIDYIHVEESPDASFFQSSSDLTTLNSTAQFFNTSSGAVSYEWNFDNGLTTATSENSTYTFPSENAGSYTVELIAYSALGCTDTAYSSVQINEELLYYVPNSFSPDGDSFNQAFEPVFTAGFDPFDYTFQIYDRYGELIFESNDAEIGWDGTFAFGDSNQRVQDGTYMWKIEFKALMTDERIVVVGHVNLIR